jgi:hypothetical protein
MAARAAGESSDLGMAGRLGAADAVSTGPVRFMLTVIAPASTIGIVDITPWRMRRRFSPAAASFAARATSDGVSPAKTDRAVRPVSRVSSMASASLPTPGIRPTRQSIHGVTEGNYCQSKGEK